MVSETLVLFKSLAFSRESIEINTVSLLSSTLSEIDDIVAEEEIFPAGIDKTFEDIE